MIAHVDKPPTIEPQGDGFLVTFMSGGEPIDLWLTRHALTTIGHSAERALARAKVAELDRPEPVPLSGAKRGRARR